MGNKPQNQNNSRVKGYVIFALFLCLLFMGIFWECTRDSGKNWESVHSFGHVSLPNYPDWSCGVIIVTRDAKEYSIITLISKRLDPRPTIATDEDGVEVIFGEETPNPRTIPLRFGGIYAIGGTTHAEEVITLEEHYDLTKAQMEGNPDWLITHLEELVAKIESKPGKKEIGK